MSRSLAVAVAVCCVWVVGCGKRAGRTDAGSAGASAKSGERAAEQPPRGRFDAAMAVVRKQVAASKWDDARANLERLLLTADVTPEQRQALETVRAEIDRRLAVAALALPGPGVQLQSPAVPASPQAAAERARLSSGKMAAISRDPYLAAMAVDAGTGRVLFEENADTLAFPASVLKLMDLLIILEKIEAGTLKLTDTVTVTAPSANTGGSQVYLKEHEVFTIDELLYALMVQSANDAAVALTTHVAGSKEAFVALMNQRAAALGMTSTEFNSVHGLPPAQGQKPDTTTARDLARLALELLKHPDALRYTSVSERGFRNNQFVMRTHNHLLGAFAGCDGLKTGYYTVAGYSMVTTAHRDGRRVLAVVLGSRNLRLRDAKAAELMNKGLGLMGQLSAPPPPGAAAPASAAKAAVPAPATRR